MSAAAIQPRITVLPPGPERAELTIEHFDRNRHGTTRFPVSAEYDGESWSSPGIDFSDYSRMSTQQRKQSGERRLPTPVWSVNQSLLRAVLVRYLEKRAMLIKPQPGTEQERMQRALAVIEKSRPLLEESLKQMCAGYVQLKKSGCDAARLKKLAEEIENHDSVLRMNNANLAGTIIRIVHLYYRCRLDSVGVGMELGLKPPHVRQILWKLRREFECMNGINQSTRIKRSSEHKAKRGRGRGRGCKVDVQRALQMFNAGKTYKEIGLVFGVTRMAVVHTLKRSGLLWKPCNTPTAPGVPKEAKRTQAPTLRTILRHVDLLKNLAAQHGGKLPTYTWLEKNGYFRSYEVMRLYPKEFEKAGLQRSYMRNSAA
jgi:hypothetical protein